MDAVSGGGKDEPSNHELSENQATGEAENSRLKAKVRELEEDKKRLLSELQVEENNVDSIEKDKLASTRLVIKEYYDSHLDLEDCKECISSSIKIANEARESAGVNIGAYFELLVTVTRLENQSGFYKKLLQTLCQEVEANDASAQEREKSVHEQLSQTLPQINVLEAEISSFRAEKTRLTKEIEKETDRAAVNREDYLKAKEEYHNSERRANQLKEQLKEVKKNHKQELRESLAHTELLLQELDHGKTARTQLEKTVGVNSNNEKGKLMHKLPTAGEERFSLDALLNSPSNLLERRNSGETSMISHYVKTVAELSACKSRLVKMESMRDSTAEELVIMIQKVTKLRIEVDTLPGIRTQLEVLRTRHAAALEQIGEYEEKLEKLRSDIKCLQKMYKEEVKILADKVATVLMAEEHKLRVFYPATTAMRKQYVTDLLRKK